MKIINGVLGLGFALGIFLSSSITVHSMPLIACVETQSKFQKIEQPLSLKIAISLAGLGLVGLELWWFLGYKNNSLVNS